MAPHIPSPSPFTRVCNIAWHPFTGVTHAALSLFLSPSVTEIRLSVFGRNQTPFDEVLATLDIVQPYADRVVEFTADIEYFLQPQPPEIQETITRILPDFSNLRSLTLEVSHIGSSSTYPAQATNSFCGWRIEIRANRHPVSHPHRRLASLARTA